MTDEVRRFIDRRMKLRLHVEKRVLGNCQCQDALHLWTVVGHKGKLYFQQVRNERAVSIGLVYPFSCLSYRSPTIL